MRKSTILMALTILLVTKNINADIGLGVSIKTESIVGLDANTLRMVNDLPEHVRKEMVSLLEQALPLLDKSVILYLKEVQNIINGIGPASYCAGAAFTSGVFGSAVNRAKELEVKIIEERSNFDRKSKPTEYQDAYSLIEKEASIQLCSEFPDTDQQTRVYAVKKSSGKLAFMWGRLKPYCNDVYTCQIEAVRQVDALISISNPEDVRSFKSKERLLNIPKPLSYSFFSKFDVDAVETNLSDIMRVNDELVAAKIARETRYNVVYPVYSQLYTQLTVDFSEFKSSFPLVSPARAEIKRGCIFYYNSKSKLVDVKKRLESVIGTGYLPAASEAEEQSKLVKLENTINIFANERLAISGLLVKPDGCYVYKNYPYNTWLSDSPLTQ